METIQRFVNTIQVTPRDIPNLLAWAFETKLPLFFWSSPGVGKSSMVRQFCKERGVNCIVKMLSQLGLGELSGLPFIEDGISRYANPSWLPTDPDWKGIIFLDELAEAEERLRAPAYELLNERRISGCGYELPAGALVIGAGNPPEDGSSHGEMPAALSDRFCHISVKAAVDDTIAFGLANGWAGEVLGYLQYAPSNLDGSTFGDSFLIRPSCRSWERVTTIVKSENLSEKTRQALIFGYLGEAVASDFNYVLTCLDNMPKIEELMKMKRPQIKKALPENLSTLYAVIYNMIPLVKEEEHLDQAFNVLFAIGEKNEGKPGAELLQTGFELLMKHLRLSNTLYVKCIQKKEFQSYLEGEGKKGSSGWE